MSFMDSATKPHHDGSQLYVSSDAPKNGLTAIWEVA